MLDELTHMDRITQLHEGVEQVTFNNNTLQT